jgi:hypothetical protein
MVAFPDLLTGVSPENPLDQGMAFSTLVSSFDGGNESRKQKRLFPHRQLRLQYKHILKSEVRTLWRFHQERKGKLEAFNLFLPFEDDYVGEYVGTTDGSTLNWNAPSRLAYSVTVYVDGSEQVSGSDYTFSQEAGVDGADLIEFSSAPPAGAQITMDFSGYLKVRARFDDDLMRWQIFYNKLVSTGLKIQGLLNK